MMAAGETAIQNPARKTETHQPLDVIIAQAAELTCKQDAVQLRHQALRLPSVDFGTRVIRPSGINSSPHESH
jgi:hypothetical protein